MYQDYELERFDPVHDHDLEEWINATNHDHEEKEEE